MDFWKTYVRKGWIGRFDSLIIDFGRIASHWNGPGILRDLEAKLYDWSEVKR